jgi:hypothetical protein
MREWRTRDESNDEGVEHCLGEQQERRELDEPRPVVAHHCAGSHQRREGPRPPLPLDAHLAHLVPTNFCSIFIYLFIFDFKFLKIFAGI